MTTTNNEMSIYMMLARMVESVIYDCVEYGEYNIENNAFIVHTSYADDEHRYKAVVIRTPDNRHAVGVGWQIGRIENTLTVNCANIDTYRAIDTVLMDYHGLKAEWL